MFKSNVPKLMALVFVSLFMFAPSANAADFRFSNDQAAYRIPATDTVHNLYTAGSNLIIDANTAKDVVAAGQTITLNGPVSDDVILAGNNVNLSGIISGSARVAGANVSVNNRIGEDLVVLGGTVYASPAASIGGDVVVLGGTLVLDAPVNGDVIFRGGRLSVSSEIKGSVRATTSQGLQLASGAKIDGDLTYQSPNMLERDPNATVLGKINYEPMQKRDTRQFFAGFWTFAFLLKLLAWIIMAVLAFAIFKRGFTHSVHKVGNRFWSNLGIGLVALIVTPVISFALLFTLIGIPIAMVLMLAYALFLALSWLSAFTYFGVMVSKWLKLKVGTDVSYWAIVIGAVVVIILCSVPVVGFIFGLILLLAGFGAFVKLLNEFRKE